MMGACTKNPLEYIESGEWNNERNINLLLLESQIGTATFDRTADGGNITVACRESEIKDISKVEIKDILLSSGASTTSEIGTTLDFSSDKTPTITVTSQAGKSLDWTVTMIPFKSDLEGEWYLGEMAVYCDFFTWESWGWEDGFKVIDLVPNLKPELDNKLIFTVEGADAAGNPFGKFVNDPGNDGKYGSYFVDKLNQAPDGLDVTERYRRLPIGEGKWMRDYAKNVLVITDEYDKTYELKLEVDKQNNQIKLLVDLIYDTSEYNWTNTDYSYEKLVHVSKRYWYYLVKEEPVIPMSAECNITSFAVANEYIPAVIGDNTIVVSIDGTQHDFTALEIADLAVSSYATVDTRVGNVVDLSDNKTVTITVTAEDGTTKAYTLSAVDSSIAPAFSIAGEWSVSDISTYVDFFSWESWGYSETLKVEALLPSISEEYDNKVIFEVTSTDDGAGVESGTYNFTAGADGLYKDFIYTSTSSKIPDPVDMNERLRIVPKGEGSWVYSKNETRDGGSIVITAGGKDYTLIVEEKADGTLVLKGELEYNSGPFDWDNSTVDYNYEKLYHLNQAMWYVFTK